jgi:hypothetical protein
MEMIMEFADTGRSRRMVRVRHRCRPRTTASGRRVRLRDGSAVLIRPVRSSDAPLLAAGFARLSARSRWMRFLTVKNKLSPAELRYLTDIDHHDHEALGAQSRDGRGVGVARYIRDGTDPHAAGRRRAQPGEMTGGRYRILRRIEPEMAAARDRLRDLYQTENGDHRAGAAAWAGRCHGGRGAATSERPAAQGRPGHPGAA